MFFDDQQDDQFKTNEAIRASGNFSPHNTDVNWTFFNVFYERTYSRWRFHFFIFFSFFFLLSKYYPLFFTIIFIDMAIQLAWSFSDVEFMTEDYFYDYSLYMSQVRGGDSRLNIYVFAYYDRLGYVIYGLSEIGLDMCCDVFKYNNYLGQFNKIKKIKDAYKYNFLYKKRKKKNKYAKIKIIDKVLINYRYRYLVPYKNKSIKKYIFNNKFIIKNIFLRYYPNRNKVINYFYVYNKDRSLTWLKINDLYKNI